MVHPVTKHAQTLQTPRPSAQHLVLQSLKLARRCALSMYKTQNLIPLSLHRVLRALRLARRCARCALRRECSSAAAACAARACSRRAAAARTSSTRSRATMRATLYQECNRRP